MYIYDILILLSLLLSGIYIGRKNKGVLLIYLFLLAFLAIFRDISIGTDTKSYNYIFDLSKLDSSVVYDLGEYLFGFITVFCSKYFNFTVYFCIIYITYLYSIGYFIKENSPDYMLSIFIFITCGFYTQSFNAIRQFWALGVSLVGIINLIRGNNKTYFICLFISFFIHQSSIILLLLYVIRRLKIPIKVQVATVITTFIIGFFFASVLNASFEMLSSYVGRFQSYLLQGSSQGEARSLVSNLGLNCMFLATLVFANQDGRDSLWMKMYFISIVIFNLMSSFGFIIRINEYFAVSQIVIIPIVLYQIKNIVYRIGYFMLLLIYALSRFYIRTLHTDEIYPYILNFSL